MKGIFVFYLFYFVNCLHLIDVAFQPYSKASNDIIDSVLIHFLFNKKTANYYINAFPAIQVNWDKEKERMICKSEDTCHRALLQYCSIREYTYELSNRFVRCVQIRNVKTEVLQEKCEKYEELDYSLISKCMHEPTIEREFYKKNQNVLKHHTTSPSILLDGELIIVNGNKNAPKDLFTEIKETLCSDGEYAFCGKGYNYDLQTITIMMDEQNYRNSHGGGRRKKYGLEVYPSTILDTFVSSMDLSPLSVRLFFSINYPYASLLLSHMSKLLSSSSMKDLVVEYVPVPSFLQSTDCETEACLFEKAILCSLPYGTMTEREGNLISCFYEEHVKNDVMSSIEICLARNHVFVAAFYVCLEQDIDIRLSNVTQSLFDVENTIQDEGLAIVLAESEEESITINADNSSGDENELVVLKKHLLPYSFVINDQFFNDNNDVLEVICNEYYNDQNKPYYCMESDDYMLKSDSTKKQVFIEFYIASFCPYNANTMDELMQYMIHNEEFQSAVTVHINTFTDVLIDIIEDDMTLCTSMNPGQIVTAFVMECLQDLYKPSIAWSTMKCIMQYGKAGYSHIEECLTHHHIMKYAISQCLTDMKVYKKFWNEKKESRALHPELPISPIIEVNNRRIYSIRGVLPFACKLLKNTTEFCSSLPTFGSEYFACRMKLL